MKTLSPASFAATVESLVHEYVQGAQVAMVIRKPGGKVVVKFEGGDRDHWLNFHESLLSHDLALQCAPNVVLGLGDIN